MDILQLSVSDVPITHSATYSCVLTNTWSGARHPIDYASVSSRAHWTPPVLLAHSRFYDLWSPGEFASPGIERVAELGSTFPLRDEVEIKQTQGLAGELVVGWDQFNRNDPPQTLDPITLSPHYPYLSSISMVAPSPDWFSGFSSFSPRGPGGFWYETFSLATYPFDAGTEQGTTYTISNNAEPVHGPIFQLTKDTVPDSGILLDPTGTTVLPMITWTCTLTEGGAFEEDPIENVGCADLMEESNEEDEGDSVDETASDLTGNPMGETEVDILSGDGDDPSDPATIPTFGETFQNPGVPRDPTTGLRGNRSDTLLKVMDSSP